MKLKRGEWLTAARRISMLPVFFTATCWLVIDQHVFCATVIITAVW